MSKPITEDEFRFIKSKLEEGKLHNKEGEEAARAIGYMVGRSFAKVSIIASCKNYEEYKQISRAEHPPVKNSLRDEIEEIKRRVDSLEQWAEAEQRIKTGEAYQANGDFIATLHQKDKQHKGIFNMEMQAQVQQEDPLFTMDNNQLLSAMTLARENGTNEEFVKYRNEVLYRMNRGDLSRWTPPQRIEYTKLPQKDKTE